MNAAQVNENNKPRGSQGVISLQFLFTEEGFCPDGHPELLSSADQKLLEHFEQDRYGALYHMGLAEKSPDFSPSAVFLYQVSDAFFKTLTSLPELEISRGETRAELAEDEADRLIRAAPFAIGAEHITKKWLAGVFGKLNQIFSREIGEYDGTVEMYLTEKNQQLHVPERIFFHLVEHKDDDFPFAFLATYATRGEDGKVRHVPLKYALTEYKNEREKLLALLACLNRAAEVSELLSGFVENGEMFHPLRLTADEAYTFLKQVEAIESTGILCRIPNWWKKKAAQVSMSVSMGEEKPSMLGFDTLVSMRPKLVVDGVPLAREDIEMLLAQTDGLAFLKGKWIEVSHERLQKLLAEMEAVPGDMTLMEALRLELGTGKASADVGQSVTNGAWLSSLLMNLRKPESIRKAVLPKSFRATLRPYQSSGFTWLNYMDKLGFGACLADDMGLGKTVQVLAYLEKLRRTNKHAHALLVVPASLIGNWQKEAEKFAPALDFQILHGKTAAKLGEEFRGSSAFLTITTYGMVTRIKELQETAWECVILDEAQAIKNPLTRQTKEIKKLSSRMRIAMTGTPIENELANLWSLFDFLNKGLLGTSAEFKEFCKGLGDHPEGYVRLKTMVAPFMLRRVKTDKSIIADLPEKLETIDYANLAKKQIVLYRKAVSDLEKRLEEADGIERRGLVMSAIIRLKQICNHPDQYLGQQTFSAEESGKFAMLKEICGTIYEKRERVLVFTQFKEITEYLAAFLTEVFQTEGFVLHGGTPVAKRSQIVEAFQGEKYVPFIVLSVKAGGTGLNLTKANHVIHFDRWWNPAVENQATDRAFRIGQTKNVMVHKLVCKGTIEEKIDEMIEAKKELAENVIGSGGEKWITELSNEELMSMMRLGI
ncbi:DEAD/DEAH box helicase [Lachnospiraceae bacterium]|nr:DEAD/DEAH box helicase [uncultured Schaedlerella sp.]MCI9152859.1 DEAD/DEAH box helicase [Ruminococcus sp.]NBI57233.1 DEAD/DEAH box helicase [Lachnospiraceae bacterium]